ncbi:hypothetical protein [Clostridium botulinum]|nr:hypothetical protein [Clostridium botulinum]
MHGTALGKSIKLSTNGTKYSAKVILSNATILGWYSAVAGSEGDAVLHGFAGTKGKYGITVNTGYPITFKFYAHG